MNSVCLCVYGRGRGKAGGAEKEIRRESGRGRREVRREKGRRLRQLINKSQFLRQLINRNQFDLKQVPGLQR